MSATKLNCDVVVIGGGATGVGILRDAAMRGFSTMLVERVDLGQGTTGRYHGLLHSGGRYVVSDPHSATECAEENAILTRIHPDAVETTGGLFVALEGDDEEYPERFVKGAAETGVPTSEISIREALRREPRLNPRSTRAFEVLDGTVDGWRMVWGAADNAVEHGGRVLTYHRVTDIEVTDGHVTGVVCYSEKTGESVHIECQFVVNAAGPWAGHIAAMAGEHDVHVVPGRGIMIAMNHRLVNSVINRCVYPADGDIIVPVHTVSIIGTTDVKATDPDHLDIEQNEVQKMFDAGEALLPGFRDARALHVWAGARPLLQDKRVSADDTRHMSRNMSVVKHDVQGLITVAGGKLTTYRLMASRVVDAICEELGEVRECHTADEPVATGHTYVVTHRFAEVEQMKKSHHGNPDPDPIVCECELVTKSMITELLEKQPTATFDDLRRQLRIGMGPCQGGFCASRTAGIAHEQGHWSAAQSTELLRLFMKNRWGGLYPILHGAQAREAALDEWIYKGTLDLEDLPVTELPLGSELASATRFPAEGGQA
ncbi:anaerobic glycerol-3-phosphate dehydrogenase subunit GlpA [Changpingibacter yushuensis]|uniref:anaerobic glycerol-3-phosphate dehydrogenase subunit GlpA n=1 Tax=Changpingibacter yushuensis TaxID=2758440 RepID=UPI0015F51D79|nr:anaerobic glycerol-3-phosphate dehydrogenase subunit GlpA [Changpingibacter yushuensis]